jgi:hypothetical protein
VTKPVRITRSRVKGSRLTSPNGLPVVCVTRGTRWGNPYKLTHYPSTMPDDAKRRHAVDAFRGILLGTIPDPLHRLTFTVDDVQRELRGKNLACFCKESPCHADVLLEIANAPEPG